MDTPSTKCATPNDKDSKDTQTPSSSEYGTPDSSFTSEDSDTEDISSSALGLPPTTVSPCAQVTTELSKETRGRTEDQESLKEARELIVELKEALRARRADYDTVSAQLTSSVLASSERSIDFAKQQADLVEAHATEKKALVAQMDDMSQHLSEQQLALTRCNAERRKAEGEAANAQETLRVAREKFEEEKRVFEDDREKWGKERDVMQRRIQNYFDFYLSASGERYAISKKLEVAEAELDKMRHRRDDDTEAMDVAVKSLQKISDDLRNRILCPS